MDKHNMPKYRKILVNGMTVKQAKLIKILATQIKAGKINLTEAGLAVYNTKRRSTASAIVNDTLEKPSVQEALQKLLSREGLDLTTLTDEAGKIATADVEKITGDVKLRAIVELLKLHRAYPDRKSAHLNVNLSGKIKDMKYQDAKEELQKMNSESSVFIEEAE